jgi:hypothetical protein
MTHLCEWEGNIVRQINAGTAKTTAGTTAVAGTSVTAKSGSHPTRAHFDWLSFVIPAGAMGSALVLVFLAMGWQSSADSSNINATEVKQLPPAAREKDTTVSGPTAQLPVARTTVH